MIHECEFYKGKIEDVTVRRYGRLSIYCRRCGLELLDKEVNPKMLKKIKYGKR